MKISSHLREFLKSPDIFSHAAFFARQIPVSNPANHTSWRNLSQLFSDLSSTKPIIPNTFPKLHCQGILERCLFEPWLTSPDQQLRVNRMFSTKHRASEKQNSLPVPEPTFCSFFPKKNCQSSTFKAISVLPCYNCANSNISKIRLSSIGYSRQNFPIQIQQQTVASIKSSLNRLKIDELRRIQKAWLLRISSIW